MDVSKEKLLAEVNELRERVADQERQLALAHQALADQERGLATVKLRACLEEVSTCLREFTGPLLDGELSASNRIRFRVALSRLLIEFPDNAKE